MPIRIVQLGTPRATGEGLRIGTVRRPPRGATAVRFGTKQKICEKIEFRIAFPRMMAYD